MLITWELLSMVQETVHSQGYISHRVHQADFKIPRKNSSLHSSVAPVGIFWQSYSAWYIRFTVRITGDHCTEATSQSYRNPGITSIDSPSGNTCLICYTTMYRGIDPSDLSICLSMLAICGNLKVGSMSMSSCIFLRRKLLDETGSKISS